MVITTMAMPARNVKAKGSSSSDNDNRNEDHDGGDSITSSVDNCALSLLSNRGFPNIQYSSTPQLLLKTPQIPSNRDQKALNGGPLGGLGLEVSGSNNHALNGL